MGAVDLPDYNIIVGQIVQSGQLARLHERLVLVPGFALDEQIAKRNPRERQKLPRPQGRIQYEMRHDFVFVVANY